MPRVTVLMAAYNAMAHLHEAVQSIQAQTYDDWKLIVVNDGSQDGTGEYLDALDDPRIAIIHQQNMGLAQSLNRALSECDSEYAARMDADDIAFPDRLAKQVQFLDEHPAVGLVGTQIQRLGESKVDGGSALPTTHQEIVDALMETHHAMCHPTIMCRTSIMKTVGGYWENGLGEEWDLFLKIGEKTELANLNEVLLSYRIHTGSLNGKRLEEMRLGIAYACEASRRRRQGEAAISLEDFTIQQNSVPAWQRLSRRISNFSRGQYRIAQSELLGHHKFRGYARLACAAACYPSLTAQRVWRTLSKKLAKRPI